MKLLLGQLMKFGLVRMTITQRLMFSSKYEKMPKYLVKRKEIGTEQILITAEFY